MSVQFDTDNAAFEDNFDAELRRALLTVPDKALAQVERPPAACNHDEATDVLHDSNGNRIGKVVVTFEEWEEAVEDDKVAWLSEQP